MRIRIKLIIISIHQYNFSQCTAPSAKMNPLLFLKQSNRQSIGNAIFAKPSAESWEIYFYSDTENWGTPGKWDDSKVAAKVTAKVSPLAFDVQTFTLDINNLTNNGATLDIIWEKSYLGVPFTVPTDKAVQASIDKTMNGPGAGDFYSAAVYYLQEGKDIAKAQKWIDKAVELTKDQPRFWFLRQQSLIHAKAGNVKGAIEAALRAKESGENKTILFNFSIKLVV